jgi:hypothetical protein
MLRDIRPRCPATSRCAPGRIRTKGATDHVVARSSQLLVSVVRERGPWLARAALTGARPPDIVGVDRRTVKTLILFKLTGALATLEERLNGWIRGTIVRSLPRESREGVAAIATRSSCRVRFDVSIGELDRSADSGGQSYELLPVSPFPSHTFACSLVRGPLGRTCN